MSQDDFSREFTRVMTWVVAPAGTAMWAATELVGGVAQIVELPMLALLMVAAFIAFRSSVRMADDRLNEGVAQ